MDERNLTAYWEYVKRENIEKGLWVLFVDGKHILTCSSEEEAIQRVCQFDQKKIRSLILQVGFEDRRERLR